MRRLFTVLIVGAVVASSCGGSSPAAVATAPAAVQATEVPVLATSVPPTAVSAPIESAPVEPAPTEPAAVTAAPVTEAAVAGSPGAGPQDGPDGVWCQTWRELERTDAEIDTLGLPDAEANERRFAASLPLLQGVVVHAPADLGVDVNAYLEATLFFASEGDAAGWDLAQFSDAAIGVLIDTIDPLGSAIEDYNMQFCGIGDFTRPDPQAERPTTERPSVEDRSSMVEMPAGGDDIYTAAEASAALNGVERSDLLNPLIETGLTEAQAECVMFQVLTTDIINQSDEAFDQVFIDCGA